MSVFRNRVRASSVGVVLFCSFLTVWLPDSAIALVIANADDETSSRVPENFSGWSRVGLCGSLTAVYLGGGWVITASHVGTHEVILDHGTFRPVPGSWVTLRDPGGNSKGPDLAAFRVTPIPALPAAKIRAQPPLPLDPVILVGSGSARGRPIHWRGLDGFEWGGKRSMRWGTNVVHEVGRDYDLAGKLTRGFQVVWEPGRTGYEAQAAHGDSGGAAFLRNGSEWQLAGILFSIGTLAGQPPVSAMPGNTTQIVDLSHYREQLESLIDRGGRSAP